MQKCSRDGDEAECLGNAVDRQRKRQHVDSGVVGLRCRHGDGVGMVCMVVMGKCGLLKKKNVARGMADDCAK